MNDFQKEVAERVNAMPGDKELCETAAAFMRVSTEPKHYGPESCAGRRARLRMEQLTGAHAAQPLSSEIISFLVSTF
jgi:hypothetical protein